jgi:hypothetical protein
MTAKGKEHLALARKKTVILGNRFGVPRVWPIVRPHESESTAMQRRTSRNVKNKNKGEKGVAPTNGAEQSLQLTGRLQLISALLHRVRRRRQVLVHGVNAMLLLVDQSVEFVRGLVDLSS